MPLLAQNLMKILPQKDFPLLEEYKKFPITNETIFPYGDTIYTNYDLPPDILVHELVHLKQQEKGLNEWENKYLNDPKFRLTQEIEAYQAQVKSLKDRNMRAVSKVRCARALSSDLYGGLISYEEALKLLK